MQHPTPSPTLANSYQQMPDQARVWIYQSDREFSEAELATIQVAGNNFVQQWAAHGTELTAAFEVFHQRFLVFFLDEQQAAASGCSIDSSVGFVRQLMDQLQVDLLDKLNLAYRNANGDIVTQRMANFQDDLKAGIHTAETLVFNNLVGTKADFQKGWEVPVKASWHRQLL